MGDRSRWSSRQWVIHLYHLNRRFRSLNGRRPHPFGRNFLIRQGPRWFRQVIHLYHLSLGVPWVVTPRAS